MPELMDSFLGKQLCRRFQGLGAVETLVWCIFQGIILIVSNIPSEGVVLGNGELCLDSTFRIPQTSLELNSQGQRDAKGKTLDTPAHPQLQGSGTPRPAPAAEGC